MTTDCHRRTCRPLNSHLDQPFDLPEPLAPLEDPEEPSELEDEVPLNVDDADWEAFLTDEDERDPLPERGDFCPDEPDE